MQKILLLTVLLIMVSTVYGDFSISRYTIDGGGGTSSGGKYQLTGAIGQPDAGYHDSGNYELLGGFWVGGPVCFVDFAHFAGFAQYWLETGTGLPADLYEDENDIVDLLDLNVFVGQWLNYCPHDWPLR